MSLPVIAIQTAAVARYRADTTIRTLLGGASPLWKVYDENGAPTNTPFPYVIVNTTNAVSGTALSFQIDAVDVTLQVSVCTQAGASGGFAPVRAIAKRVYDITQKTPFDITSSGFHNFFLLFTDEVPIPSQDGITQEVAMRFRLMIQG